MLAHLHCESCALLPVRRDTAAVTSARRCGGEAAPRTVDTARRAGTAASEKQPTTSNSKGRRPLTALSLQARMAHPNTAPNSSADTISL